METFNESGLRSEILDAISELGFITPTPIQKQTIPAILDSDSDLVALAQTGTGKTAAFGLPVLERTNMESNQVQTLILCPTRELCVQITSDMAKFSKNLTNYRQVAVYGGSSMETQIRALKKGCQTVVGTPGRVLDLVRRKVLHLSHIRWLILDEADEMLRMGFKEDLDTILSETPQGRQTLLFSATMPKEIVSIAGKYMNHPREISIGNRNAGAENVRHEYYMVNARDRYMALKRIIDMNPSIYGIVFCRTRQETKDVADKLMQDGYNADALHGDLSQAQRDYVMNRFRVKNLQLLVATDVAARGLDVNDLTHILNYNLPDDLEIYTHRSGRTGRAGKKGLSVTIIHTRETGKIKELERNLRKQFERKLIPTGKEICEKQLFNLVDKVENTEVDPQIEQYLPSIYKKLEWLGREDLIKHFISVEFNRFLTYYKDAVDMNVVEKSQSERREPRGKSSYSRFFMSLGSKDGIDPVTVIGMINKNTRNRRIEIGKIEILKSFSFFEIDSRNESVVQSAFKEATFKGSPIHVELSKPDTKKKSPEFPVHKKKSRKRVRRS
jgi:ATP-dependent RNA helicase DeaD